MIKLVDKIALTLAEDRYRSLQIFRIHNTAARLNMPTVLSQVSPKYRILHEPYTALANLAGIFLMMHAKPELMPKGLTAEEIKAFQEGSNMIRTRGGTVNFEREYGENCLEEVLGIFGMTPEYHTGIFDPVDVDNHVLANAKDVMPNLLAALRLPDHDSRVGLYHAEMQAMRENVHAFMMGKLRGLDVLTIYADVLRQDDFFLPRAEFEPVR